MRCCTDGFFLELLDNSDISKLFGLGIVIDGGWFGVGSMLDEVELVNQVSLSLMQVDCAGVDLKQGNRGLDSL